MRKILFFLSLFICSQFQLLHAQWSTPANAPTGGQITCAINTSYPGTGSEVLFGGTFTDPVSPVCVKYSTQDGFIAVTGFTPETDTIHGFFLYNSSLHVYGRFKVGTKYYGAMKLNATNDAATPNATFEFKGPFKSFAKIKTVGVDDANNVIVFGDTLAGMGAGMNGVNLMAAKVANINSAGVVTALPQLKPIHSAEIPSISTIGWDTTRWIILGNFETLGTTQVTDLAIYENNNITAINTHPGANLYSRGYAKEFIGWNGTITTSGVNSPGLLKLNGTTLVNVGTGWQTKARSVTQAQSNIWITGSYTSLDSRIATWSIINSNWIDRTGNLIASNDTTDRIDGVVFLSGDTMFAYGGFNSNFPGIARAVITNPPLPVELTSFTGQVINGKVVLVWGTQKEKENSGFFIERSSNQLNWEDIGLVIGKGTTSDPHNYDFVDQAPLGGRSYYRLRQVDNSEEISYSNIISVEIPMTDVKISPNPASENLVIEFTAIKEGVASLNMIDAAGTIVRKEQIETIKGLNTVQINTFSIVPGNYNLKITFDDQTFIQQVIISR